MKKKLLILWFILVTAHCAFAQSEKKFAVGLGPEFNMNSRYNFAAGAGLGLDYALPVSFAPFAVGLNFTASYNFSEFTALEAAAAFRWYFLGGKHKGFFAQAEGGFIYNY